MRAGPLAVQEMPPPSRSGKCGPCVPVWPAAMSTRQRGGGFCKFQSARGGSSNSLVLAPCPMQNSPVSCGDSFWVKVDSTFARECIACKIRHPFSTAPYYINTHNPTFDRVISGTIHRRKLFDEGVWTFIQGAVIGANLSRKGVAVDIGGNIGWFTLLMLAHGLRVTTFEPMTSNVNKILESVARNGWGHRHRLYQNALGSITEQVTISATSTVNPSNGRISNQRANDSKVATVFAVPLDAVIDEDVVLMKIDVESFELRVLNGARHLLCNRVVQYILLEVAYTRTECDVMELHDFLQKLGYDLFNALNPPPYGPDNVTADPFFGPNPRGEVTNDAIYALRDRSAPPCARSRPVVCDCITAVQRPPRHRSS